MADPTVLRTDFYVYVMFRHDTGEPFYVGKGHGPRAAYSLRDKHNCHKSGIIKKAKKEGVEIPVVKIAVDLLEKDAFKIEVAMIAAIGREPRGPLVNLTDGGDGTSGHVVSPKARETLRAATKAQMTDEVREQMRRRGVEQFSSQEARDAMSAACRIAQNRPETKAANKARCSEQAKDSSFRARLGEISRAYNSTDDARRFNSESAKARWATPVYRNRVMEARALSSSNNSTDEKCLANSAAAILRWSDPIYRKRVLDARAISRLTNPYHLDTDYRAARSEQMTAKWADPQFRLRMTKAMKQST